MQFNTSNLRQLITLQVFVVLLIFFGVMHWKVISTRIYNYVLEGNEIGIEPQGDGLQDLCPPTQSDPERPKLNVIQQNSPCVR